MNKPSAAPIHPRRLLAEMLLLFGVLPVAVLLSGTRAYLPILWVFALAILRVLWRDPSFSRGELWNARAIEHHWRSIALRFLFIAPLILGATYLLTPELMFGFPRERPGLFLMILFGYPIVSVYPQGIIYRAFLTHRYQSLFGHAAMRIGIAALCFGFLHIIFRNPVAPVVTILGGVLFTWTHERSRSLFVSSVEHALYGLWLMASGWGAFLYPGAVDRAMQSLTGSG